MTDGDGDGDGDSPARENEYRRSFDSNIDRAVYLLSRYRVSISLTLLGLALLYVTGLAPVPDIPPWVRTGLKVVVVTLLPFTILTKLTVVDWLIPDQRLKVAVVDPQGENKPHVDVVRVRRDVWARRIKGKFAALSNPEGPVDYVVRRLEWDASNEELYTEGVNPELVDATELLSTPHKVDEIYDELLDRAYLHERLLATLDAKMMEWDVDRTTRIFEAVEHSTTFDGGKLRDYADPDGLRESLGAPTDDESDETDADPTGYEDFARERPTLSEVVEAAKRENDNLAATNGSDRS